MIVHYPTYIPRLPFQGFREKVMHHLIQKPTENIFQNEANQANLGSQKNWRNPRKIQIGYVNPYYMCTLDRGMV